MNIAKVELVMAFEFKKFLSIYPNPVTMIYLGKRHNNFIYKDLKQDLIIAEKAGEAHLIVGYLVQRYLR